MIPQATAATFAAVAREITEHYSDPVDLVWLQAAREVGLRVVRSNEVFAAYDGEGTLTICAPEHFDPDDSLAQMIFHELCHALVAGPKADGRPDWGMQNVDERDLETEHACHRLQAALADRHGLRALLAVTTDHRTYWDALPLNPLGPGDDPSISVARQAMERATEGPWAEAVDRALSSTRTIANIVRPGAPASNLWGRTQGLHRAGFPLPNPPAPSTCGDCTWAYSTPKHLRCRQTRRLGKTAARIAPELPACVRFEARLDAEACAGCGACCRETFDVVQVRPRETFTRLHPELVVRDGYGLHVPRPGGRCVALSEGPEHLCRLYADRPRNCRDFQVSGDACLEARRRLGLSV